MNIYRFFLSITVGLLGFLLLINPASALTSLSPATLPAASEGIYYSQDITASTGFSYYWLSTGTLPPGLTRTVSGGGTIYTISGTPTTPGDFSFTLSTTRIDGGIGDAPSRTYTLTVRPRPSGIPLEILTPSPLTSGRVGNVYRADLLAMGGNTPYTWSVVDTHLLPPGITISSGSDGTGKLLGTPTTSGTYTFRVKLTDIYGNSAEKIFTLTIASAISPTLPIIETIDPSVFTTPISTSTPSPTPSTTTFITPPSIPLDPFLLPTSPTSLTITTATLPSATVGTSYSTSLSASGGTAPYRWNFASGSLPPGLTLSSSGVISGSPTESGSFSSYIEVFDSTGRFVGTNYSIVVRAASSPSTTFIPLPTSFTTPFSPVGGASAELTARLDSLARNGISVHQLVKLPDDGNRFTQADSAVYYIGADGRRHAFPNDRVYATWYRDFSSVRIIDSSKMASVPLGANVTYKPAVKLVKFTTDPKVYAVSTNRVLRWVKTEAAALALYGSTWNRQIDDIADTFYIDYSFGLDIGTSTEYDRTALETTIRLVSDVLPL